MANDTKPARCPLCDVKYVKNGRNTAGNQRWICPTCGASFVRKHEDRSKLFTLHRFLDWLLGKTSQAEADGTRSGRSFRRQVPWCWDLRPRIPITGDMHDVAQIDGFNLRTGWCVLVAISNSKVIALQWCSHESQAAWSALFTRVPAPAVVVCDGGPGMHAALKTHWPDTRVQRCLVHLQRNVRKYVTTRSKTVAGKTLWGLARKLTRIRTAADAEAWSRLLLAREADFLHLTKERSYRKHTAEVPSWVRPAKPGGTPINGSVLATKGSAVEVGDSEYVRQRERPTCL